MKYGLSEDALKKLHHVFSCEENIEQVILYGSRAKGNYKPFSDVDIRFVRRQVGIYGSLSGHTYY